ncbi:MAG: TetR/AcrR family transcriptional regulator [Planctomycetota bacterium]|nr:TetR/AcrR family transcriptional regulator [Planctomycetota bacterium]
MSERNEQTRQAILKAAAEEFRRRGYQRAGMRDIAATLDMAVGNLYYYFKNKQAIITDLQQQTVQRLISRAETIIELPIRADTRLFLLILQHVHCINFDNPGSFAHMEIEELEASRRDQLVKDRRKYESFYHRLIGEGIGQALFRPTDVKLAALAILGAINYTSRWYKDEGRLDPRSIGHVFAEYLAQGLMQNGLKLEKPHTDTIDQVLLQS